MLFGVSCAERNALIRMIALASLSESARKIALDRFRLLQSHLEEQRLLKACEAKFFRKNTPSCADRARSALLFDGRFVLELLQVPNQIR
jgi:hypothetical protein